MNQNLPLIINKDNADKHAINLYADVDQGNIERQISSLSSLPHVKEPIILLADFHHKPMLETPSSSVITTQHYFSPALTSPSQNCGMSLIQTPFTRDHASPLFINRFMSLIKKHIPLANQAPILSREEVLQALLHGATWAINKYDISSSILNHIECNGNLLNEHEMSISDLEHAIPNDIIELSRTRFKIIGGGNHFLELQYVDEIIDDTIAENSQVIISFPFLLSISSSFWNSLLVSVFLLYFIFFLSPVPAEHGWQVRQE